MRAPGEVVAITSTTNGGDGNGDIDSDNDDDDEKALRTEAERTAMKATILRVAINLTDEGLLGARGARAVNDMVKHQSPVLVAAFKVRIQCLLLLGRLLVLFSPVHRVYVRI